MVIGWGHFPSTPDLFHLSRKRHTSSNTKKSIFPIKPFLSKRGMNFEGGRSPMLGLFHLMSASAPTISKLENWNLGWKYTSNSPFDIALFIEKVMFFFSSLASSISFVYSITCLLEKDVLPSFRAMFALSIIE